MVKLVIHFKRSVFEIVHFANGLNAKTPLEFGLIAKTLTKL